MTVVEYFKVLRRGWALVLTFLIIGGGSAFGYSESQTPVYQASCRLFVAMGGVSDQSSNISGAAQFAAQRVRSYTQVVASPDVLQPIIDQLHLAETTQSLAKQISVTNPLDTVLLDVAAKNQDPVQAASISNLACSHLGSEVEAIERIKTGLTTSSAVTVSVISPASEPLSPVSPRKTLNLALGMLLGLAIGAGIVILRETLDTRLKDVETIVERMGASPIGLIPFDSDRRMSPLVALSSRSSGSEAFRSVRTNLQYVDVDNPPKVFVITSSVPNEGKSTTAANLAITFALNGAKVLVVEADLRLPRLSAYMGTESSVGLTDVLAGTRELDDVIVPFRDGLFDLLPAGKVPPNPSELLGSDHMRRLINTVRGRYDITILDSPPLLPVTDAAIIATQTDGAIVVARHNFTRREQLEKSVELLEQVSAHLIGTIVNFVPTGGSRRSRTGYGYGYGGYGSYGYGGYGSYGGGGYGSYGGGGYGGGSYGSYGGGYGGYGGYEYGTGSQKRANVGVRVWRRILEEFGIHSRREEDRGPLSVSQRSESADVKEASSAGSSGGKSPDSSM